MILFAVVIVDNEPFCTVISALELKLATASENCKVTVDVSPEIKAVSLIVNELTDGTT